MRIDARDLPLWLAWAFAFAVAIAIVQTLRLWWLRYGRARRLRAQAAHAAAGEARAERLLVSAGFDVLARQVTHRWIVRVDGAPIVIDLRADYIVERGARRFVAEVKTGRFAPRIDSAATRRQMLEYRCAFDVDGVLLVDADAEAIHAIEFDLPRAALPARSGWSIAIVIGAGAAIAALALAIR
jgi:hypothetical protein